MRRCSRAVSVMITGAFSAGRESLMHRLFCNSFLDPRHRDCTGDFPSRSEMRTLPDDRLYMLAVTVYAYLRDYYIESFAQCVKTEDVIIIVYRVDVPDSLTVAEEIYVRHVKAKRALKLAVILVAMQCDLLPVPGLDLVTAGRTMAERYKLPFFVTSAKTGQGCDDVLAEIDDAVRLNLDWQERWALQISRSCRT